MCNGDGHNLVSLGSNELAVAVGFGLVFGGTKVVIFLSDIGENWCGFAFVTFLSGIGEKCCGVVFEVSFFAAEARLDPLLLEEEWDRLFEASSVEVMVSQAAARLDFFEGAEYAGSFLCDEEFSGLFEALSDAAAARLDFLG